MQTPMQTRKLLAIVLATVAAAAACGGSGSAGSKGGVTTVDISVTHPTDVYVVPWLAAIDQGFFEKRGVKIGKIVPGKGGGTTLRSVLQGGLAIGDVAYPAVVEGYAAGAPVKIVGGATQSSYNVQFYALASNTRVNRLEDVRTWAFTNPGSVTQAFTYLVPQVAGVDSKAIKRVAAGGVGEGIALLEANKADIATIPPSIYLKTPDKYKLVVDTTKYLPKFQQTVLVTSPDYAKSNPEVIKAITAGYAEGAAWAGKHPDEAGKLFAKQAEIPENIAVKVVKGALAADTWGVGFNAQAIESGTKALKATGFDDEVPYCELFTSQYLPSGAGTSLPGGGCGS